MAETRRKTRTRTATRPRPARTNGGRPHAAEHTTLPVTAAPTTTAPVAAGPLGAGLPVGLGTAALAADVSGQLQTVAPTFGDVLRSIGTGVAESQKALDAGVIDTVRDLATTNISVVTDVVQHLNDDGEPNPAVTEVISTDLSVLNFFMPTIHEWKRVSLQMDLSVGAFSESNGVQFSAHQHSEGVSVAGLFWGFLGVGETHDFDAFQSTGLEHQQESSWSQGDVRVDAIMGPRTTQSFPTPTRVDVGPQIVFSQGALTETPVAGAGVNRSIDVLVRVLTHAGAANPGKALTVQAAPLRFAFSTTAPFTGSTTNAEGNVQVTFTRNVANAGVGAVRVPIAVRLNSLTQTFDLTI